MPVMRATFDFGMVIYVGENDLAQLIRRALLLDDLECSRAQPELVEDLRPVPQIFHPCRSLEIFRHDNRVAGHGSLAVDRSGEDSGLSRTNHRAVRSEQIDARPVGLLTRTTR